MSQNAEQSAVDTQRAIDYVMHGADYDRPGLAIPPMVVQVAYLGSTPKHNIQPRLSQQEGREFIVALGAIASAASTSPSVASSAIPLAAFRLLSEGVSRDETAQQLGVSAGGVSKHRQRFVANLALADYPPQRVQAEYPSIFIKFRHKEAPDKPKLYPKRILNWLAAGMQLSSEQTLQLGNHLFSSYESLIEDCFSDELTPPLPLKASDKGLASLRRSIHILIADDKERLRGGGDRVLDPRAAYLFAILLGQPARGVPPVPLRDIEINPQLLKNLRLSRCDAGRVVTHTLYHLQQAIKQGSIPAR